MEDVLTNRDMLKLMFSALSLSDLCKVCTVCHTWRTVSCSEEFWRDVSFEGRYVRQSQVREVPATVTGLSCGYWLLLGPSNILCYTRCT